MFLLVLHLLILLSFLLPYKPVEDNSYKNCLKLKQLYLLFVLVKQKQGFAVVQVTNSRWRCYRAGAGGRHGSPAGEHAEGNSHRSSRTAFSGR